MSEFFPPPSSLPPGSKVVAYLRDSGGREQEISVDRQEQELRRWCATHALDLVEPLYIDQARTAKKNLHKRHALLRLMDHFRNGGEELGIIIWNYERFARNAKHGRAFLSELEALDKSLVSLTDHIPEGPERFIFQDLKLYSAEMTSAKLSVDVTSGLRRMVELHGGMPGFPPRGFRRSEPITVGTHRDGRPRIIHRWEPDPALVDRVRQAFTMRSGGATLKQIMDATQLFKSINSWATFFSNRLYVGELCFGDLVIPGYCEPVVDEDTWKAANLISQKRYLALQQKGELGHHARRLASEFLLSGIIFCQHCGSPMNAHVVTPSDKKHLRREYYSCTRRARRRDCPAREVPRLKLEEAVIDALIDQVLQLDQLLLLQARVEERHKTMAAEIAPRRKELNRQLAGLRKKIANINTTIADFGASQSLFNTLRTYELEEDQLRQQLDQIQRGSAAPPRQTERSLRQLAETITAILRDGSTEDKRQYLNAMISRILVSRNDGEIAAAIWYIPPQVSVWLRGGTPGEEHNEGIQISIPIPAYVLHKASR